MSANSALAWTESTWKLSTDFGPKLPMKDLYRLYIDEVGNHDMKPTLGENERFLSLLGVIVNSEYMADVVQPDMRRIKRDFFHRSRLWHEILAIKKDTPKGVPMYSGLRHQRTSTSTEWIDHSIPEAPCFSSTISSFSGTLGKKSGDVSVPGGILLARPADVQIPSRWYHS